MAVAELFSEEISLLLAADRQIRVLELVLAQKFVDIFFCTRQSDFMVGIIFMVASLNAVLINYRGAIVHLKLHGLCEMLICPIDIR